jgi:hypothetical protein
MKYPIFTPHQKFDKIKYAIHWLLENTSPYKKDEESFLWRHMASFFPLQWCLNFDKDEFAKFRIENQDNSIFSSNEHMDTINDDVPFATSAECCGPM